MGTLALVALHRIFYDHGPSVAGGLREALIPRRSLRGIVERGFHAIRPRYSRQIKTLAETCVDTGMGLERIAAVMQGVHDNYDIDIFQHLLKALSHLIHHANTTTLPCA